MRQVDWQQLSPLPRVAPWNKGKRTYSWQDRLGEYSRLPTESLLITAQLATPIVAAEGDATHLDSILSVAAMTDHPHPSAWEGAAVVPLPLHLAWVSPQGRPLWACTPLMPAGDVLSSREYWHKRYPAHRAEFGTRQNAATSAGRWREYRVPIHATSVERLHAMAIGNRAEIERLLAGVSHIGKKGSIGYGRVACWTVTNIDCSLTDIINQRAVPQAYFQGPMPGVDAPGRGWTPPYWYAPWWDDCRVPG